MVDLCQSKDTMQHASLLSVASCLRAHMPDTLRLPLFGLIVPSSAPEPATPGRTFHPPDNF